VRREPLRFLEARLDMTNTAIEGKTVTFRWLRGASDNTQRRQQADHRRPGLVIRREDRIGDIGFEVEHCATREPMGCGIRTPRVPSLVSDSLSRLCASCCKSRETRSVPRSLLISSQSTSLSSLSSVTVSSALTSSENQSLSMQ